QALLERAEGLLEAGHLAEAKALYTEICQQDAGHAEAWLMLGALQGELGATGEALRCFEHAIELRPDYAEAHLSAAAVLQAQGKLEEAYGGCRRAVAADTEYVEAWAMLGGLCSALGKREEAETSYQRAAELTPESVEIQIQLGHARAARGRHTEAVENYRRAAQLQPGNAELRVSLAKALEILGLLDEAETSYHEAIRLSPAHAVAHAHLGALCLLRGRSDEALPRLSDAVRLNPQLAEAHAELAVALENLGKREAAEKSGHEAASLYHSAGPPGPTPRCEILASDPPPENLPEIWCVIPHYGADTLRDRCLASLNNIAYPKELFGADRIIVINNNPPHQNLLFTAAVNAGIAEVRRQIRARSSETRYLVWVLNNDTVADQNCVAEAVHCFRETGWHRTGIVGSRNVHLDQPDLIVWGGSYACFPAGRHKSGRVSHGDLKRRTEEEWVTFSSVFLNGRMIEEIGVLDRNMRHIASDSDYCLRARAQGWRCYYEPRSTIRHAVGTSNRNASAALQRIMQNDMRYFQGKWLSGNLFGSLTRYPVT
ncbi:MAG: tetratricopeptide repeat protein, partial [Acidiferrobacteraceae bacterium]